MSFLHNIPSGKECGQTVVLLLNHTVNKIKKCVKGLMK